METLVIKRDGSMVKFDKFRIYTAIIKAMRNGSGVLDTRVATLIAANIEKLSQDLGDQKPLSISEIETQVINQLVEYGHRNTAFAYENFRAVQAYKRTHNTSDNAVEELLNYTSEIMDENSNKNGRLNSTQRDLIAGEISKDIFWRKAPMWLYELSQRSSNRIHWHDADYSITAMTNCCNINLEDMLENGTVVNGKLIETPKSFTTAALIATQIVAHISSNQYGGQTFSISHLAKYLYVSYQKEYDRCIKLGSTAEFATKSATSMRKQVCKDGVQSMRYQSNTLLTTNGQAPFGTIYLEVHVGGEYEKEEVMIIAEMLRQRRDKMKNYKGQAIIEAFPKLVYVLDSYNDTPASKYGWLTSLAIDCLVETMAPDFQSKKIMTENYGGNFPPMGCRSHLVPWTDPNTGKLKWYGRFNQGVVTINLPQIGILAHNNEQKMWDLLEARVEDCHRALRYRHELLLNVTSDVSPIHWQHGGIARLKKGELIKPLLYGGYSTLSLGYIGLQELVYGVLGKSITSPEGTKLAKDVLLYMKHKCEEWYKQENIAYSLYGTPAESTCYSMCKKDRELFGIVPGITDKDWYTNSYHVDPREPIDAFSKLKFEAQFHAISSGGCVSYVELPNMRNHKNVLWDLVTFCSNNVQYAEFNLKPDICYKCGSTDELTYNKEQDRWECSHCGNHDPEEMQCPRRTCGYIGTTYWNKGKTQEINSRVMHL